MSRRRSLLLQAAAGGPTFFGNYSMLREFWAEDPDWTNPGDGVTMTSWRDAGSIGSNVTAETIGTGPAPKYVASGINAKPAISFDATSETNGGGLRSIATTLSSAYTIVAVGRFRTAVSSAEYIIDSGTTSNGRSIIGALSGDWRGGSAELLVDAGTPDTSPHVFTLYVAANDGELWVDGVSIGTDTSGALDTPRGIAIGANNSANNQCLDGLVAYVGVYDGDLTAQAGYSAWLDDIQTYYGI